MKEMTAKEIQDRSARIAENHLKKDEESASRLMKKAVLKRTLRAAISLN